jgi:hypothetical protein
MDKRSSLLKTRVSEANKIFMTLNPRIKVECIMEMSKCVKDNVRLNKSFLSVFSQFLVKLRSYVFTLINALDASLFIYKTTELICLFDHEKVYA